MLRRIGSQVSSRTRRNLSSACHVRAFSTLAARLQLHSPPTTSAPEAKIWSNSVAPTIAEWTSLANSVASRPTTESASAQSPAVPRVLCWYKPNSTFDMDAVAKTLEERNIPIEVCFPSSSSSTPGTTPPVSAGAASKKISPQGLSSHKTIEVLGFSIKGRTERESRHRQGDTTPTPPNVALRRDEAHGVDDTVSPPNTTYIIRRRQSGGMERDVGGAGLDAQHPSRDAACVNGS